MLHTRRDRFLFHIWVPLCPCQRPKLSPTLAFGPVKVSSRTTNTALVQVWMRDVLGGPCRPSPPGLSCMAERSKVNSSSEAYLAPSLFKLGSRTHGKVQTLVSPDVPGRIRARRTGETLASLIQDADRSNLGRRAPRQGSHAFHARAPRTGHVRRAGGFPQEHTHGSGVEDASRAAIGGTHGVRPCVRRRV